MRERLIKTVRRLPKRFLIRRKIGMYAKHPFTFAKRRTVARNLQVTDALAAHVQELKQEGFTIVTDLIDSELLTELDKVTSERLSNTGTVRVGQFKNFWRKHFEVGERSSNSPFVRYALQENVLKIISTYLGQIPYLADIDLAQTVGEEQDKWKISQLWHRDYNDSKMVKLFTYFNDVENITDGPLTYIPADKSRALKLRYFPIHKSDDELRRAGGLDEVKQVFGPKFTSFLLDTYNCYHLGSRLPPGKSRIALIATYVTFASYYPYDNQIKLDGQVTPLQKLVLTTP